MKETRRILKVEFANDFGVRIFPAFFPNDKHEYIYRTASGVDWNSEMKCFLAAEPTRWEPLKLFSHIVNEVSGELGLILVLDGGTEFAVSEKNILDGIVNEFFRFNLLTFPGYEFVFVNEDGTAREVSLSERLYLQTKYLGGDGDRPYIKTKYGERTPNGKISGFCYRRKLPKTVNIELPSERLLSQSFRQELDRVTGMGYEINFSGIEYLEKALFA